MATDIAFFKLSGSDVTKPIKLSAITYDFLGSVFDFPVKQHLQDSTGAFLDLKDLKPGETYVVSPAAPLVRPPSPPKLLWKILGEEAFKEMPVKRFMEADHPYGSYYVASDTLAQVGSDTSEETLANKFVIVRGDASQPSPSLSDFPAPAPAPAALALPSPNSEIIAVIEKYTTVETAAVSFDATSLSLSDDQRKNHSAIAKKYKDTTFSAITKVLCDLSGLSMPLLHQPTNYQPKSKYLRQNLPSAIGSSSLLDLRLLPGDLDRATEKTEVVDRILRRIEEKDQIAYADVSLLLGGHAVGKTKAIFDLSVERFTIILDFSADKQGQKDIQDMYHCIGKELASTPLTKEQIDALASKCAWELLVTCTARHIALELYLATGVVKTPLQWRTAQLNGFATKDYSMFLKPIRHYLRFNFPTLEQLIALEEELSYFHRNKQGKRPILALDEANILLTLHTSSFFKVDNTTPASLWYLAGTTFGSLLNFAMVVAGTRIRLRDQATIQSPTVKTGVSAGQTLETYTQFRFLQKEEKLLFFSRLFTDELKMDARQTIASILPGRIRFITDFADFLDQKVGENPNADPTAILMAYRDIVLTGSYPWTLRSQLDALCQAHNDATDQMCKILQVAFTKQGVIDEPEKEKIDWLAGGLCHASPSEPHDTGIQYQLDEPLVITAIQLYLQKKQVSLSAFMARKLFELDFLDESTLGFIFDLVVLTTVLERGSTSFDSIFGAINSQLDHQSQVSIDLSSIQTLSVDSYEDFIQSGNFKQSALHPDRQLGFDGVLVDLPAQVIYGNKTSYRKNNKGFAKAVDNRDVKRNEQSTRLENIYTGKGDGIERKEVQASRKHREASLGLLSTMVEREQLTTIIRIHFILPFAPIESIFKPGVIRLSKIKIKGKLLHEINVDLDSSCFALCGLFPERTVELLQKKFQLRKGQEARKEWKVSKAYQERDIRSVSLETIEEEKEGPPTKKKKNKMEDDMDVA